MQYVCAICGYVYDEEKEAVPFASLPDDWKCPWCGALKENFEAKRPEAAASGEVASPVAPHSADHLAGEPDMKELSPGQLSALCSNLARGCEKQYKPVEADLFKQLADYFAAITPAIDDANVMTVARLLQNDIDDYAGVRATADEASDRGAARVCVWGEKVTRMLSSLVDRYLKEGEQMLEGTRIWVCTICGFVFIGDNAPELCPVCKVPAWKFELIEGRK